MSSKVRIDLTVPVNEATFIAKTLPMDSGPHRSFTGLSSYFEAIAGAVYAGKVHEVTGAVAAYGLITVTTTGPTNGQAMTLGNETLTAKTSGADPTAGEFDISATANTVAINIALAINSMADLSGVVTAAVTATGVVTVTAVAPGMIGNGMQMDAGNLSNTAITAFAHGDDGHTYDFNVGQA